MWWVTSCRSKKNLRTDSRMNIEEIIKMKLETIKEEPDEPSREEIGAIIKHRAESSKVRKARIVVKSRKSFPTKWRLKQSYVLFMNGFASKGGISGLPRY
ncbi:hypothetical protein C2S53_000964 [Perilla frutescens var. hirtella]|uniref:Uncharacterized protein n=1 Tax=Perilla frutescens var. hirtella TaxID=608512 RepID=A0AAD4JPJ4_PERFH|nr:hypothetical protein C2S53_000964 [Perilla frutescens var. hirtella]